jgi:hypothetical protein
VEELEGLFKVAIGKLSGKKEAFALRTGGRAEGEVTGIVPGDRLALKVGKFGEGVLEVPIKDLAEDEILRVVQLVYGRKNAELTLKHGLKLCYGGRLDEGEALLEAAQVAGVRDVADIMARVADLRSIYPPEKKPAPKPEGPVVAGGDSGGGTEPGKPPKGGTGTQGREGAPPVDLVLDKDAVQKLFEGDLLYFDGEGKVTLHYGFVDDRKATGNDWELQGEPLRYDVPKQALKADEGPTRVIHKGHFVGALKIQMALEADGGIDGRKSALSLSLDDVAEPGTAIESIFGMTLLSRKRGRPVAQQGVLDPADAASKTFRAGARYTLILELDSDGDVTATLDGERRATLLGLPLDVVRRPAVYLSHVNIQVRSILVEGRIDLAWAAAELKRLKGQRSPASPSSR